MMDANPAPGAVPVPWTGRGTIMANGASGAAKSLGRAAPRRRCSECTITPLINLADSDAPLVEAAGKG